MYDRIEDARSRLDGTIIRLGGAPIKVISVDYYGNDRKNPFILTYFNLVTQKNGEVLINHIDLDFEPVLLGYVNQAGHAFYVERIPVRLWKVGLHPNNIEAIEAHGMRFRDYDKSLANTILDKFPSLREAFDSVNKMFMKHCAFSRKFAVDKDSALWYKGTKVVGRIKEDGSYSLSKEYFYLKEELEEVLS